MSNLWLVLKKELKEMFRDTKSLSMMLIIPILIPILIIGMSAFFDSETDKDVNQYNKIGFNYELSDVERNIIKELDIVFTVKDEKELKDDCNKGSLNLYVTKKDNNYTIHGINSETTNYSMGLINTYFKVYKEYLQKLYLNDNNIDDNVVLNIISVDEKLVEKDNFFANYITTYGFLFIIMAITVSATYPATDTTAGEKERGTLETLLTFPIKSKDIIIGKFLSVSLSSIITGIISLLLMIVSLNIANDMFKIYEGVDLMMPLVSLVYAIIIIITYSLLISGLCIAIASKSKTFKEAQSALTPLTFISFFPGMIAFMANIKTTAVLSLVPFLNFTLIFGDVTKGDINIFNLLLMIISTFIIIASILFIIIRQYKSEKVLFSD